MRRMRQGAIAIPALCLHGPSPATSETIKISHIGLPAARSTLAAVGLLGGMKKLEDLKSAIKLSNIGMQLSNTTLLLSKFWLPERHDNTSLK